MPSEKTKNPAEKDTSKKPKNKKKMIIIISIAAAAVIAAAVLVIVLAGNQNADDFGEDVQYIDVTANNYFGGVVEPQQTSDIQKDVERTVSEVYVKVGDIVKKGDRLFSYDTEEAQNKLSTAKIEYEGIQNNITEYDNNIALLTRQRSEADASEQLDYTSQIQEAEASKAQAELELRIKQVEIDNYQNNVDNAVVTSPIDGIIKQVNSSDSSGAFITVLMNGAYRVKGKVDEMNVRSLEAGMSVLVHSRVDEDKLWRGTISKVDTSSNAEADNNNMYGNSDSDSSSRISFYVTLDNSDGLLMGEHVYIEPIYDYSGEEFGEDADFADEAAEPAVTDDAPVADAEN